MILSYAAQKHAKVNNIDLSNELLMFILYYMLKDMGKNYVFIVDINSLYCELHCRHKVFALLITL